jgi:hypothetical protein
MHSIPFSLKVPGKDEMTWSEIASTSFKFRGFLRLEPGALLLEWAGSAEVEEVTFTGVRTDHVDLPSESLLVPLDEIRTLRLVGGWLRPRLELTATSMDLLRMVPGEDGGRVRLWLARQDRAPAGRLVAAVEVERGG